MMSVQIIVVVDYNSVDYITVPLDYHVLIILPFTEYITMPCHWITLHLPVQISLPNYWTI